MNILVILAVGYDDIWASLGCLCFLQQVPEVTGDFSYLRHLKLKVH